MGAVNAQEGGCKLMPYRSSPSADEADLEGKHSMRPYRRKPLEFFTIGRRPRDPAEADRLARDQR